MQHEKLTLLYNDYYKALVSYSMQMTGDQKASEDVVQSVFQKICENDDIDLEVTAKMKAYLYNSVRNMSINYLRHQGTKSDYVEAVKRRHQEMTLTEEGEEELFGEEVYRQLFLRIDALPERQREVFLLCMEGRSYQEIADALQISRATVKQRKRKGIELLRIQFGSSKELMLLLLLLPD